MTKRRTLSDGKAIGRVLKECWACCINFQLIVYIVLGTLFFLHWQRVEWSYYTRPREIGWMSKGFRAEKMFVDWALEAWN
jgi:hypothetical protein